MQLTAALEQALGRELPPTLAFDYPTVRALVAFLATACGTAAPEPAAEPHAEMVGAESAPCQLRNVEQQTPQSDAAARLQVAIAASDLRLPEAGIRGGSSMFDVDRFYRITLRLATKPPPSRHHSHGDVLAKQASRHHWGMPKGAHPLRARFSEHLALCLEQTFSSSTPPPTICALRANKLDISAVSTHGRVSAVPLERWDVDAPLLNNGPQAAPARFGGWLCGAALFEHATLFGAAAADAARSIDPQQRLVLDSFRRAHVSLQARLI